MLFLPIQAHHFETTIGFENGSPNEKLKDKVVGGLHTQDLKNGIYFFDRCQR
jgi:hypothetical protein